MAWQISRTTSKCYTLPCSEFCKRAINMLLKRSPVIYLIQIRDNPVDFRLTLIFLNQCYICLFRIETGITDKNDFFTTALTISINFVLRRFVFVFGFTNLLIFICRNYMFYGCYWSKLAADGLGTSTVVDENLKSLKVH